MLNALSNANFDQNDVESMMQGHLLFLKKNTGRTDDATKQHYVFNPEMILSNNRHFIARAQMEAQPNGDATTEGQSLQIIGFCYAYMATGISDYLQAARDCFDAYIEHFYAGQPIPNSPQRYICNWLVNGKEPVLANWPVDLQFPTHSGFKGQMMNFVNGKTQIPHGEPYWGEYVDKVTFAFDGALGWDSIVGAVKGINPDGSTDWNSDGIQYDCEWVISYTGQKITGDAFKGYDIDGNYREGSGWILSENHPVSEIGTVQLGNHNVQGNHKLNWGNRQPVEHGGYMMQRNEVWHNRPLNVPVAVDKGDGQGRPYGQLGNASDAEQWFADAAYLLYKITGESKYWTVWQCVIETVTEYSNIDSVDRFFRQEVGANTPWTDGISYDYQYPSGNPVGYIRDENGYIGVTVAEAGSNTMEQQAVWYLCDNNSKVRTTIGGRGNLGTNLNVEVTISMANGKTEPEANWTVWKATLPYPPNQPTIIDTKMDEFLQLRREDGSEFVMADARSVVNYGDSENTMMFQDGIIDGRRAQVSYNTLRNSSSGVIIGFWLTKAERLDVTSIVMKSNMDLDIGITDDDGWYWHWRVASTGNQWKTVQLPRSGLVINDYQANLGVPPASPRYSTVDQIEITQAANNPSGEFTWYSVNEMPRRYNLGKRNLMKYSMNVRNSESGFSYKVGDCMVVDYLDGDLFCTPGVIPFSNIYTEGSQQFDGWHGMPYPGYQYPFVWLFRPNFETRLNNMVEFMYQSQTWFQGRFGTLGPGASAYVWNRWDNYKYGTPDTWTMYHWGDGHAWAGYQPRAYFGAARAWYELVLEGKTVPPKLITYVENWTRFLSKTMEANGGYSPTDFTTDGRVICDPNDFTGHMCGLFLAGACISYLAGSKPTGIENLIEMLASELNRNYEITPTPDHVMNGSWSPALRLNTGSGPENNGMFFGFWSGEILRGLGLYLLYKKLAPKEDMYKYVSEEYQ